MFIQVEAKSQGWRALAIMNTDQGPVEALLFLGRSSTQIRAGYVDAFQTVLDDEERERVTSIELQQWQGAPDAGKWLEKAQLRIPAPVAKLVAAAA